MTTYVLDCSECAGRQTDACDDCIVAFLIDRDEAGRAVLDGDEVRAVRVMSDAGLVPSVRHLRAVS